MTGVLTGAHGSCNVYESHCQYQQRSATRTLVLRVMGINPAQDPYYEHFVRDRALGELDENVDRASTLQVSAALVRAGKDHELVVFPSATAGK